MRFYRPSHLILDTKIFFWKKCFYLKSYAETVKVLSNDLFLNTNLNDNNTLDKKPYKYRFDSNYNTISDFYASPKYFFSKNIHEWSNKLIKLSSNPKIEEDSLPKIKGDPSLFQNNENLAFFEKEELPSNNVIKKLRTLEKAFLKAKDKKLGGRKDTFEKVWSMEHIKPIKSVSFFDIFDINYLKRERLYTKLKYSRSPAYDIVSGGAAAFLAAFIGFLVSEKFGIELVDSGDFYIAFMYAVFIGLSLKPFMRIIQSSQSLTWSFLSRLKAIILFFFLIPKLVINFLWKNKWFILFWCIKLYFKFIFLSYFTMFVPSIKF